MSTIKFVKGECGQCAGHLEFAASDIGAIVQCPHCGQQTELLANLTPPKAPSSRKLVYGIVAASLLVATGLVVAIVFFKKSAPAIVLEESNKSAPSTVATPIPAADVNTNEFTSPTIKLEKTPGSSLVYITGTIRNLASRQRFGIKLEFGLFDTNGMPVGKATDYHQVLEPHADWSFKALVFDSKAASARLNSIHEDQ